VELLTNGYEERTLFAALVPEGTSLRKLRVAVAFFSDKTLIERTLDHPEGEVELVVSLRYPTNPDSLALFYRLPNVSVRWLDDAFHSKIYLCEYDDVRVAAAVGSSNLTRGGLLQNIETNLLLNRDEVEAIGLQNHFEHLWKRSVPLTPAALADYREAFRECERRQPPSGGPKPVKLHKEAESYVRFWNAVDLATEILSEPLNRHFADLPPYLALDHFWYYIGDWTEPDEINLLLERDGLVPTLTALFERYANWDQTATFHDFQREGIAKLQRLLAPAAIGSLTSEDARGAALCLHSIFRGRGRNRHHEKIAAHDIAEVRDVWNALLHEDAPLERRISQAMQRHANGQGIRGFGPSGIQELNGWYRPDECPIRNAKADQALGLLRLW
jgi:HKD family nuclease